MKHQSFTLAIETFNGDMPSIVDHFSPFSGNVANFVDWETSIYDSSAPGEPDEAWDKECPDHEHDCWREGCGRTVSPDWWVEGNLTAKPIGSNKRVVLARWVNHYRGGYGI
jgi:hypothetical protein